MQIEKPFEHDTTILELSAELGEIEAQLDLDRNEISAVIDEEAEADTTENETEIDEGND